jgi:hypothetical protein
MFTALLLTQIEIASYFPIYQLYQRFVGNPRGGVDEPAGWRHGAAAAGKF